MTKQQDADGHPSICRNYFRYRSPGGLHPQRPAPTVRGCRGSGHSVSLCQARCSDCQETSGKVACVKLITETFSLARAFKHLHVPNFQLMTFAGSLLTFVCLCAKGFK